MIKHPYIYVLLYGLFCIEFAYFNYWMIEIKKWKVKHFLNGLLHCAVAGLLFYYFGWQLGVATLFMARVCFDTFLNLFRGKPLDYVSPEVISYTGIKMAIRKGKVIDYLSYKVFGKNGIIEKLVDIVVIVALLFA